MKIGFLPLYVKLYDDAVPAIRPRLNEFYEKAAKELEARGAEVVRSPFCRIKEEFRNTIALFEKESVDAIVTLHMAYSPSLEAIEALTDTSLPIIVMDTTETLEFTNEQSPAEISYCHGIHGVMDLCSMLNRYGKPFAIAAGHWQESDCIDRVCGFVRAAAAAKALSGARVGLIGGSFAGMGDFRVPYSEMAERFGIKVIESDIETLGSYYSEVTEDEIKAEKAANLELCEMSDNIIEDEYTEAVRSCLAARRFIKENGLTAFSANFLKIGADVTGITSVPFLEACKSMRDGIGYAGEGDTLTAAFVGALLQGYIETTFVEIFCPDWKNNTLFLSHMGEMNYRISETKPLIRRAGKKYGITDENPYAGYARMKGGKGVYVNVCHTGKDFRLTLSQAEMLHYESDSFPYSMRGWMRPGCGSVAKFLENHSKYGATHHSIFVYGAGVEEIEYFGKLLGMDTVVI